MAYEKEGEVSQPVSQNSDKYAEYYSMDEKEQQEAGTSTEPERKENNANADVKQAEAPKEESRPEDSSPKEKQEHVPNWKKKINRQTAQIKELEKQLNELKAKKSPEYGREHFVSDNEYREYDRKRLRDEIAADLRAEMIENQKKALEEDTRIEADNGFQESWARRVDSLYGNGELRNEFNKVAQDTSFIQSLPEAVHDYLEDVELAPAMLHALYLNRGLADRIALAKPIVQTRLLMQLESEIESEIKGAKQQPQQQQQKKPNAPAPTGVIGQVAQGLNTDDDIDDATAYAKYLNRRR